MENNKTNKNNTFNINNYRKLHYIFKDINNALDGYRYYSAKEIKENEKTFIISVIYNNFNYIYELINMLEEKYNYELINRLMELV